MKSLQALIGAGGISALLFAGPGLSTAGAQIYAREDVLGGQRYETMRSLAHYLDEGTQFTLDEATDILGERPRSQDRAFLNQLRNFAKRTDAFHEGMDENRNQPDQLDREVRNLSYEARRVDMRLRRVSALRELRDDWAAVVDDLNRMQRLMAGYDVQVPPAHAEWADRSGRDENGYGYPGDRYGYPRTSDLGGYRTDPLSGQPLTDFRRLAHDLDTHATRAYDMAVRNGASYAGNRQQYLDELEHFADATRALHDRSDADRLDPREVGPTVTHLLADARRVDRGMRNARVLANTWEEWQQTIAILEQMDTLVRR
jgi:hypothetical protein